MKEETDAEVFADIRRIGIAAGAELRALRSRLETAEGLLRVAVDGGMTDYTDAPNEPICGFCGYTVEDCESGFGQDAEGQSEPCKGREARAFLAPVTSPGQPGMQPGQRCTRLLHDHQPGPHFWTAEREHQRRQENNVARCTYVEATPPK